MKNKFRHIVLTISQCLFSLLALHAQNSDNKSIGSISDNPQWIKMMDDPKTNYYEAVKTYEEYWKHHVKPAGEEEEMKEGEKSAGERKRESKRDEKKGAKIILTTEELKIKNEEETMKYQVKRFEQWMREVKPFVQEDGRILTDRERMDIWNKQQEEIKNQKK
jgi:hypothetical protein